MFSRRLRESLAYWPGVAGARGVRPALARQRGSYRWWVFAALTLTAIVGTTTYGMTMGTLGGAGRMLQSGLSCTLAAGIAWALPLPGCTS